MTGIYDNGCCLLGKVSDILNYVDINNIDIEDYAKEDIIDELSSYDKDSIVCIDYDSGMWFSIEEFKKNDILKEY